MTNTLGHYVSNEQVEFIHILQDQDMITNDWSRTQKNRKTTDTCIHNRYRYRKSICMNIHITKIVHYFLMTKDNIKNDKLWNYNFGMEQALKIQEHQTHI